MRHQKLTSSFDRTPPEHVIVICGSRTFDNYQFLCEVMDRVVEPLGTCVAFTGACPTGADELGKNWAASRGIGVQFYFADWAKHGKAAGPVRNAEMLAAAGVDAIVVAFWDGHSPGTKDCIDKARRNGNDVRVVKVRYRAPKPKPTTRKWR